MRKYLSEAIGTFGIVFMGCGAIIFASPWIGYLGIAMAFGFAVSAMMYAFGSVSGGHFNPAVTVALTLSGRFKSDTFLKTALQFFGYIFAQTLGAVIAGYALYYFYSGKIGFVGVGSFGANIVDRYTLQSAFYMEAILSFLFLCVFLGSNAETNRKGFAPVAVGFVVIVAYLILLPVTKGSLNPVRSTAMALFAGQVAINQLWLFWSASISAGVLAGIFYHPKITTLFKG